MDISDTESDDHDNDYVQATDDEWEESGKFHFRKRKSKSEHSGMENNQPNTSLEPVKDNNTTEEGLGGASGEKTASDVCCSCSKSSSCKTAKCKCKALGFGCGSSCGCRASKCANRAPISAESQEPTQSGSVEGTTGNDSSNEEADKERILATHGAELLQGALVERPAEAQNGQVPRKALSDIGNTLVRVVLL